MIENIIVLSSVITLPFMALINYCLPQNLRIYFIFEPFVLLVLLIASLISINISLFIFGYLTFFEFFILLFYFVIFFSTLVILRECTKNSIYLKSLPSSYFSKIIDKNNTTAIWCNKNIFQRCYLITIILLIYSIINNFEVISLGFNHGNKTNLYNDDYLSKLNLYFDMYIISFLIFINFMYFGMSSFKINKFLIIFFIILVFLKSATGLSRASMISIIMSIAPLTILYQKKSLNYLFIFCFPLLLSYGLLISSEDTGNLLLTYGSLIQRIFLSSDFALWFKYYDNLNFENFRDYDALYYAYPILSKLTSQLNISSGLGPYIVSLYTSENFGNGPIPSFYYEYYILFKGSIPFLFAHSIIYALIFFTLRFMSFKLLSKMRKLRHIYLFYYIYFLAPFLFSDYFLFFSGSVIFLFFSIIFYFIVTINLRNSNRHITNQYLTKS